MNRKEIHKVHLHFLSPISLKDRRELRSFVAGIFAREGRSLEKLDYIFCDDEYLLAINRQHLQHDYYTDIISFDLSAPGKGITGEIYISVDRVRDNAAHYGAGLAGELHRVVFHGALHLCGYKDKSPKDQRKMRKMEDQYLSLYFSSGESS